MTIDLKKYLAIETAGGGHWHPDRSEIVFTSDISGSFQIYSTAVVESEAQSIQTHTVSENRSTNPRFLKDGSIVFTRDVGGDENFQIHCISPNGMSSSITGDLGAKHLIMSPSEHYLYFRANIEDKTRFDIYRQKLPLTDHPPEKLFQPEAGIPNHVSTLDDKIITFELYYGAMRQDLCVLDLKSGQLTMPNRALSEDEHSRWQGVRWVDEETLLVMTDYQSDLVRLAMLSRDGNFQSIEGLEDRFDIQCTAWTKNSAHTYFAYNDEGYSRLFRAIITKEGITQLQTIELPVQGVISSKDDRFVTKGIFLSNDGKRLSLTLSAPHVPTGIWVLDMEKGDSWQAVKADCAGLDSGKFIDAELERFNSFDGLSVPFFRYLPTGKTPAQGWPAILIIHGGPESQMTPAFQPQIQFFLANGFAVITPNIRGSAGYGKHYLKLDNVEKRLDSIRDIQRLAFYLRNDLRIDTDHLVIFGASYGGFAVLSSLTEYPDLWCAGVDIVGISNFVTFLQNTAPWRRKNRESVYGSLENDREVLERVSPIHKIDRISAPLFIIQGDNDERVPLSESVQIHQKLKEKNLETQLLRFDDEGHGITKLENRITAFSAILEWLKTVLGPAYPTSP